VTWKRRGRTWTNEEVLQLVIGFEQNWRKKFGDIDRGTVLGVPQEGPQRRSTTCLETLSCNICGKTEGIMRCSRCKTAGYCGKKHQKADWKAHKKICIRKDGQNI
jgi:hypothetical protein